MTKKYAQHEVFGIGEIVKKVEQGVYRIKFQNGETHNLVLEAFKVIPDAQVGKLQFDVKKSVSRWIGEKDDKKYPCEWEIKANPGGLYISAARITVLNGNQLAYVDFQWNGGPWEYGWRLFYEDGAYSANFPVKKVSLEGGKNNPMFPAIQDFISALYVVATGGVE